MEETKKRRWHCQVTDINQNKRVGFIASMEANKTKTSSHLISLPLNRSALFKALFWWRCTEQITSSIMAFCSYVFPCLHTSGAPWMLTAYKWVERHSRVCTKGKWCSKFLVSGIGNICLQMMLSFWLLMSDLHSSSLQLSPPWLTVSGNKISKVYLQLPMHHLLCTTMLLFTEIEPFMLNVSNSFLQTFHLLHYRSF